MTVLPHGGGTHRAHAETQLRRTGPRKFDHQAAADARAAGHSWRTIAAFFGVDHKSVRNAVEIIPNTRRDAARSPIPCPAPDDPPPPVLVDGGDASAGGLRGAPAGNQKIPVKDQKEAPAVEPAGAPIVRRQRDGDGDTVYIVELPATTRYQTHARSMVDALLGPFDASSVRWINEED